MSKSPNKKKRDIGTIIAVIIWPSIFVVGLLLTVFRELFSNFSILGLIILASVILLIVLPLIGGIVFWFTNKSDDQ